jgi:hypothetical protein
MAVLIFKYLDYICSLEVESGGYICIVEVCGSVKTNIPFGMFTALNIAMKAVDWKGDTGNSSHV